MMCIIFQYVVVIFILFEKILKKLFLVNLVRLPDLSKRYSIASNAILFIISKYCLKSSKPKKIIF